MQTEQLFLQDQIASLRKRLATIQLPANAPERQASAKLVKAYEIRNITCVNLRKQLIEIIGLKDANAMFEKAERDAEVWWSTQRSAAIECKDES
jgi:hypothetical protein